MFTRAAFSLSPRAKIQGNKSAFHAVMWPGNGSLRGNAQQARFFILGRLEGGPFISKEKASGSALERLHTRRVHN